jgi:hypothetical protein
MPIQLSATWRPMEEKAKDCDAKPRAVTGIGSLGGFAVPAPDAQQATIGSIGIGALKFPAFNPLLAALLEFDETAATIH